MFAGDLGGFVGTAVVHQDDQIDHVARQVGVGHVQGLGRVVSRHDHHDFGLVGAHSVLLRPGAHNELVGEHGLPKARGLERQPFQRAHRRGGFPFAETPGPPARPSSGRSPCGIPPARNSSDPAVARCRNAGGCCRTGRARAAETGRARRSSESRSGRCWAASLPAVPPGASRPRHSLQQFQRGAQMFQHVGADDVIELAASGAASRYRDRRRRIPRWAGADVLGQSMLVTANPRLARISDKIADGAAHIEHPPAFPAFGKFGQQQRVAAIRRRFELISGSSLGCRRHRHHYDTAIAAGLGARALRYAIGRVCGVEPVHKHLQCDP